MASPPNNIAVKQENYSLPLSPQIGTSSSVSSDLSPIYELPDEMIGEIFSHLNGGVILEHFYPKQVCKKWKIILEKGTGAVALKLLLKCERPYCINPEIEFKDNKWFSILPRDSLSVHSISFTDKSLSFLSTDSDSFFYEMIHHDYQKPNFITNIVEFELVGDNLYLMGVGGPYRSNQDLNQLDALFDGFVIWDPTMFVDENRRFIAFTARREGISIIYDTIEKSKVEIKDELTRAGRLCAGITFAGDRVAIGYKNDDQPHNLPYDLAVYNLEGKEIITKRWGDKKIERVLGVKNFLVVQFSNSDVAVYNPDTLEEKYVLKKAAFRSSRLKTDFNFIALQNGCLYIHKNSTFRIFDLSTGIEKMNFYLGAVHDDPFLIQDDILAFGSCFNHPVLPDEDIYKLQLWNLKTGSLLGEFEAKDRITTIAINKRANGILEIAAGLKGGIVQVWSPRIDFAAISKEEMEKANAEK